MEDSEWEIKKNRRKKVIDWQHEFTAGKRQHDFDMPEFVAVFLAMIRLYETQQKADMRVLLELLMIKTSSYAWKSVRFFYACIAQQVELSRLDFHNISEIRKAASTFLKHSDLRLWKSTQ